MIFGQGVDRNDDYGVTAQRMDNDIAHIKTNTLLCCKLCNLKSICIPHDVMLENGANIREEIFFYCAQKNHVGDRLLYVDDECYRFKGRLTCRKCDLRRPSRYKRKVIEIE